MEIILVLPQIPQKIKEDGMLSNSFYEARITVISKPARDTEEKWRTIFLMNIVAKVPNKNLANQIQHYISNVS